MTYARFDYKNAMPTPWGKADSKHEIMKSVYEIGTPSHGGIMVGKAQARKLLSKEAIKQGMEWNNWICFEEDCAWAFFVYEQSEIYAKAYKQNNPTCFSDNPEKCTSEAWKDAAKNTIEKWYPEYFN